MNHDTVRELERKRRTLEEMLRLTRNAPLELTVQEQLLRVNELLKLAYDLEEELFKKQYPQMKH